MIKDLFDLSDLPEIEPRYNIAPTQDVLAIAINKEGESRPRLLRWGLVPSWAKDPSIGQKLINARAEGIAEKPSFRKAFEKRRCLIPADGFYEWMEVEEGEPEQGHAQKGLFGEEEPEPPRSKKPKTIKQPFHIGLQGFRPFAFAGLWEVWRQDPESEPLVSCTIITTTPNELVRPLHDRMPVILPPESFDAWLDHDAPLEMVQALLQPYPSEEMACYAVSTLVNSPRNEGAECIEPLE